MNTPSLIIQGRGKGDGESPCTENPPITQDTQSTSGKTWPGEVGMRNRRPTALWGTCQDPQSGEHGPGPGSLTPHGRLAFSSPPFGSAQCMRTDGYMHPPRVLVPHALPGSGLAGAQLCTSPPPQPPSALPIGFFKLRTLPPLPVCSPSRSQPQGNHRYHSQPQLVLKTVPT